jgi:hypothetical protein
MLILCLMLLWCGGCTDHSVDRLVAKSRAVASAEEWRGWAEQLIERKKTNTTALPFAEWPGFVKAVANDGRHWEVRTWPAPGQTNDTFVGLLSPGGFQSIGIIIGPPTYVEPTPEAHVPQTSEEIYPGIYVREVH